MDVDEFRGEEKFRSTRSRAGGVQTGASEASASGGDDYQEAIAER